VMLCCFVMMVSGMRTMFRCLFVVLGCFFRHAFTPFGLTEAPQRLPTTAAGAPSTETR
jgi:hypothetical protein